MGLTESLQRFIPQLSLTSQLYGSFHSLSSSFLGIPFLSRPPLSANNKSTQINALTLSHTGEQRENQEQQEDGPPQSRALICCGVFEKKYTLHSGPTLGVDGFCSVSGMQ